MPALGKKLLFLDPAFSGMSLAPCASRRSGESRDARPLPGRVKMSRMREVSPSPRRGRLWPAALLPLLVLPLLCLAQEGKFVQHPFEGRELAWQPGAADAVYKQTAHKLSEETTHGGHRSELIELEAQQGNHIHYVFPVGRAIIDEDFTANVWVRANRPGAQLMARLVLPRE